MYQYLIKQLGCAASEVLFVGDAPSADVTGSSTFGMSARLIDWRAGQTLTDVLHDL